MSRCRTARDDDDAQIERTALLEIGVPMPTDGDDRMMFNRCQIGDCRETLRSLPDGVFQTCVTSPPYWGLRDYGHADQLGLEATPEQYVEAMVGVFREVRRTLKDDGTLWLNIGDSYARSGVAPPRPDHSGSTLLGSRGRQAASRAAAAGCHRQSVPAGIKPKDLVGIPWRLAFALQADGWYLRSDIIWAKPNPLPESVTDRPTKAHEYVFLMAKSDRYYFDAAAIGEATSEYRAGKIGEKTTGIQNSLRHTTLGSNGSQNGMRNARTVWTIPSEPYGGAHFAVMPSALVTKCVLAGSRLGDAVLDPFFGSGTVGQTAEALGRKWFGCELNPDYERLIRERTAQAGLVFG